MTGAAKDRISQSSPIDGLAELQARDQHDPGQRRRAGRRWRAPSMTVRAIEMPESSAAWGLPPTARM